MVLGGGEARAEGLSSPPAYQSTEIENGMNGARYIQHSRLKDLHLLIKVYGSQKYFYFYNFHLLYYMINSNSTCKYLFSLSIYYLLIHKRKIRENKFLCIILCIPHKRKMNYEALFETYVHGLNGFWRAFS